jgi:hypothetical protein
MTTREDLTFGDPDHDGHSHVDPCQVEQLCDVAESVRQRLESVSA